MPGESIMRPSSDPLDLKTAAYSGNQIFVSEKCWAGIQKKGAPKKRKLEIK
jgi:hypothetical protein